MGYADAFKKYLQRQQDEALRLATKAEPCFTHTISTGIGGTVTVPHEHRGGQPTDGTETVTDVAAAVKKLARADKGRTLMSAIDRLHAKRVSNGKPLVYVPE